MTDQFFLDSSVSFLNFLSCEQVMIFNYKQVIISIFNFYNPFRRYCSCNSNTIPPNRNEASITYPITCIHHMNDQRHHMLQLENAINKTNIDVVQFDKICMNKYNQLLTFTRLSTKLRKRKSPYQNPSTTIIIPIQKRDYVESKLPFVK